MNTLNYQILKEKKWSPNMILVICFLKHITTMCSLKMNNRMMQQEKVMKQD